MNRGRNILKKTAAVAMSSSMILAEEVMYGLRVPIRRQRGHLWQHLQNQLRGQLMDMRRM